jgi:hypothetical protein
MSKRRATDDSRCAGAISRAEELNCGVSLTSVAGGVARWLRKSGCEILLPGKGCAGATLPDTRKGLPSTLQGAWKFLLTQW